MNESELIQWVNATEEHTRMVDRIVEDRLLLKNILEKHLSQFFNWVGDLKFNRDFSVVEMTLDSMVVDNEKLADLLMPWGIEAGEFYFTIYVYPFGVPNDEGEN